jgi:hypothetical protein
VTVGRLRWIAIGAAIAALVAFGAFVEQSPALTPLKFAIQRNPDLMPSAAAVPDKELRPGVPTVSLALPQEALHHRLTGILTNKLAHGRQWERFGTVSFFDGARLVYSAPVGVRVHGGGSRLNSKRQGFRLYFRKEYGLKELPPGIVFGPDHAHPLNRLVIHNDVRCWGDDCWHLVNPLAYDIVTRVGGIAAATEPARFYLNGEFQGVFVLTEHFHPKHYFKTHFGHEVSLEAGEFDQLWQQLTALKPLRMANAGQLIDLDNLTRWFIATVFVGAGDPFQGPGQYRDPSRSSAQWFFVNWDMDAGGFQDPRVDSFSRLLEGGAAFRTRRRNDPRPYVMTTLLREDPQFREMFERVWVETMNFRLTPAFLRERFEHYRDIAERYGVEQLGYLPRLETFLKERPENVWNLAERYVKTGPRQHVVVRATTRPILIDGHPVEAGFDGFYFPGMHVALSVPEADRDRFSYWVINGMPQPRGRWALSLTADRSLEIAAVWK